MTKKTAALPHIVIRASAGTGKTFQLSNRFLKTLALGTQVDAVLATTFTRKAAGEILDRVLVRMADAALDPEKLEELNRQIRPASMDQSQCGSLLLTMLQKLHRLRVGTLDSFYHQIARAFSLELGLAPGWRMMDETEKKQLQRETIQVMLQKESVETVVQWFSMLNPGQADRSISTRLLKLAEELHQTFLEAPAKAWKTLKHQKHLNRTDAQAAIGKVAAADLPQDKRFFTTRDKAVELFEKEAWEAFIGNGLVKRIIVKEDRYYNKPIDESLSTSFEPLIRHARAHLINELASRTQATGQLLERFDRIYQELKRSRNALYFDDVTRLLLHGNLDQWIDETAYRLDSRISHLLFDEFQDTSSEQWRVLQPFVEQVTREEGNTSFFCVGDMKQAIYGWRGGVAEIFESVEKELACLVSTSLNKSWRSAQGVIDSINRVFGSLADNGALSGYEEAAKRWVDRFDPHTTVHQGMPSYCRLETAPLPGENEKAPDRTLAFAAGRIAELHRKAPHRSIGVLVRTNKAVANLIYLLRSVQGIAASEEGGNPLLDSPAVELVISLLRLADHPGNRIARHHVASSPLGRVLGYLDPDRDEDAWSFSRSIRENLIQYGYGPTLYAWVSKLAPHLNQQDLDRLIQLVELGYRFEDEATLRTDDFIERVSVEKIESPSFARVRVMTIHKAKGLQFDAVVLPQLEKTIMGQKNPLLVVGRKKPTQPIESLCRYAK
ncbi:MAG: UvrD-helicase domain-containing protein, partial [Planctomycetes bacterium]|nr:UvrD-helicase domain-containing protein [Planctomycetota bacterium]